MLTGAIVQAASTVHLGTPAAPGLPARTLYWGCEHGIRPVTATGDLTDSKVAAYVAKYATKAAECTGTLNRRITPGDRLADLPIREHARRLIAKCLRLGRLCRSRVHVAAARLGHADPGRNASGLLPRATRARSEHRGCLRPGRGHWCATHAGCDAWSG